MTIGEDVAAIGNPEGLEASVSAGIVSGRRQAGGYQLIQTTAPVSPGSSGGPLFNMQGRIIGITSAQLRSEGAQNLNFAVPIIYIRPLLDSHEEPISVAEFAKRLAAAPAGTNTGGGASDRLGPTWRVVHDHGNSFTRRCVGVLAVHVGSAAYPWEISFTSQDSSTENWRVVLPAVQSVRKNAVYGRNLEAFTVRLNDNRNFNYYVVGPDGRPMSADGLFNGLRDVASSRAPR